MNKVIVIFSGGPDSTAAAQWAVSKGYPVELLTFQFTNGRSQDGELHSAKEVSKELGLQHTILDFSSPMHLFSSQSRVLMHIGIPKSIEKNKDKPHLLSFGSGMVLSTVACYAIYNEVDTVIWGATKDDGYLNKDYTQNFATSFANLISEVSNTEFKIIVPFSEKHKYEVLSNYRGQENLFAKTFSCLFPIEDEQCGICKACITRRVSAELANLKDYTRYINKKFKNPLSEDEINNPEKLTDDDFEKIINEGLLVQS